MKEAERLKVANERAVARRIAKESMALVEDERLELMELAASSKGLPTVVSLDFETLQNLDLFRGRDSLNAFVIFCLTIGQIGIKIINSIILNQILCTFVWVSMCVQNISSMIWKL